MILVVAYRSDPIKCLIGIYTTEREMHAGLVDHCFKFLMEQAERDLPFFRQTLRSFRTATTGKWFSSYAFSNNNAEEEEEGGCLYTEEIFANAEAYIQFIRAHKPRLAGLLKEHTEMLMKLYLGGIVAEGQGFQVARCPVPPHPNTIIK